jgi:aminoglycoside phosphotransferase (APT) family kinase protein
MRTRIEAYLHAVMPDKDGLRVTEFQSIDQGNSNKMAGFKLCWRDGGSTRRRSYILRMPSEKSIMEPYDPVKEYLLLKALMATRVPVPPVLVMEEDESILGKPFLIMERVSGNTLSFAFHAQTPEKKQRLVREYASTLADIHSTPWEDLRRTSLKVPVDASQFAAEEVNKCAAGLREIHGIPRLLLEDAIGELSESIPASGELTLVHGDYNVGNVLFNGEKIAAVLDWETAGIGDPAVDIGWLYPANSMTLGLPLHRDDFIDIYQRAGGRCMDNLPFYQSLAMVKLTMTGIRACLAVEHNNSGGHNLLQMGYTLPYILNSLCYLVTLGLKALHPSRS